MWHPVVGPERGELAMWVVFATVCAVAVPFYVRFLVAMCREYRYARISYLVRIEPTAHEESVAVPTRRETMSERAA